MDARKSIDVALMVKMVNCVLGRLFKEEKCKDFVEATGDKYPASKCNRIKGEDELINKVTALNFGEDWMMFYTLKDDMTEKFELWRRMKKTSN